MAPTVPAGFALLEEAFNEFLFPGLFRQPAHGLHLPFQLHARVTVPGRLQYPLVLAPRPAEQRPVQRHPQQLVPAHPRLRPLIASPSPMGRASSQRPRPRRGELPFLQALTAAVRPGTGWSNSTRTRP
jgi:hypothetical protein